MRHDDAFQMQHVGRARIYVGKRRGVAVSSVSGCQTRNLRIVWSPESLAWFVASHSNVSRDEEDLEGSND